MALLQIDNLQTSFTSEQGVVKAVRGVSFSVDKGEILGIVGESGSGKSVTMFSLMGLLANNGKIVGGDILFNGQSLVPSNYNTYKEYKQVISKIRGNTIGMIFQDPMTFLNPVLKIKTQLMEPILNHHKVSRKEAYNRAINLLKQVGIPSPEKRMNQYPFEFSGGMRQRIVIAMALACTPSLIIADEPTTALDVTIQAQILELIDSLRNKTDAGIILITHDLGVVAKLCDNIAIMYGGMIVEKGSAEDIFYNAQHPYTLGLLGCISNPEKDEDELTPIPGSPPDLLKPPAGCPFVDRCQKAMKVCKYHMPYKSVITKEHSVSCWLQDERSK
ncbi:peptide ABC transporter ATP-binding protein [Candidatus Epulonipiscium fishelsonii]|uniref:Peptide ABC transporter ATP-binding protein n=1 Tax=Candidatus Epulonipiscium fishelsonii TaxID=77094 RepID=A0ACC8XFF9_9FIRM|nr:peptide ABC transporter ATP-binding protein [Epulopiscium sp. SCG-B05WGA-EpuloA1]ONI41926.1 peptide ABC transporter ATP-binding protein [Epulopiscium sp. SCG-B11WGA-EpuloA1]